MTVSTTTAIALPKADRVLIAVSSRAKTSERRAVIQVKTWSNEAQEYTDWVLTVCQVELFESCNMVTSLARRLFAGTGHTAVSGHLVGPLT